MPLKHEALIRAALDGKQIQYETHLGRWLNFSSVEIAIKIMVDNNGNYRIQPEDKEYWHSLLHDTILPPVWRCASVGRGATKAIAKATRSGCERKWDGYIKIITDSATGKVKSVEYVPEDVE